MAFTVTATATDTEPPRPGRWGDIWPVLLLALATCVILAPVRATAGREITDEGLFTDMAYRIFSGQVPHRDFHYHAPFGPSLPLVIGYCLRGASLVTARYVAQIQLFLIAVVVYANARLWGGRWQAWLAGFTFLNFNAIAWPIVSHHWQNTLALLTLFFCLQKTRDQQARLPFGFAGASLGWALLTAQNGFAVGAAFVALFWILRRRHLPSPGWAVLGFCLSVAPYYMYLGGQGLFPQYFEDNFGALGGLVKIYQSPALAFTALRGLGRVLATGKPAEVPWSEIWSQFYALSGLYLVFLGCLCVGAARVAVNLWRGPRDEVLLGLALLTIMHGIPLVGFRFMPTYMGFIDPFLYLLCLRGCYLKGSGSRFLTPATVALTILANSFTPALQASIERNFSHPVHFQDGDQYYFEAGEAGFLTRLQELLQTTTRPGERIFWTPSPVFQFLSTATGKLNACPYPELFYSIAGSNREPYARTLEAVKAANPPLLILVRVQVGEDPNSPVNRDMRALNQEVLAQGDYQSVLDTPSWEVFVRKDRLKP